MLFRSCDINGNDIVIKACQKTPPPEFCNIGGDKNPCKLHPEIVGCQDVVKLNDIGYEIDSKGNMKTPKGTIPSDMLSSGDKMAKAGFLTPGEGLAYDEALKKLSKDGPRVSSVSTSGGGGAGGGGGVAMPDFNLDEAYKNMFGKEKPNAPKTKGLTRSLASGESIGAKTDNIFEMISRRYEQKKQEKIFVEK